MSKEPPSLAYDPTICRRDLIFERQLGVFPPLPKALLQVTHIISRELSLPTLSFAGIPARRVTLDEAFLTEWLKNFHEPYNEVENTEAFYLKDRRNRPNLALWLRCNPFGQRPCEEIEIIQPERFPLAPLLAASSQIYLEFGARYGYVRDSLLSGLHGREVRAYEIALSQRRPEEHQYLIQPEPIEGVSDDLPPLLLAWEFDTSYVPEGVWWINIWSKVQVDTMGLDRIQSANWFHCEELPGGSVLAVATEAPLDMRNSAHRERLGEIVQHLSLGEIQEQFRIPPDNRANRKRRG
jgi:hypothetical protein